MLAFAFLFQNAGRQYLPVLSTLGLLQLPAVSLVLISYGARILSLNFAAITILATLDWYMFGGMMITGDWS
jgi:hypothetical protein